MVLDNGRTVIVYIFSVTVFQAKVHALEIVGLVVLIIGKFELLLFFVHFKNSNFSRHWYLQWCMDTFVSSIYQT